MLHILNGDALREQFEPAGIPGATLVWREALCEGPVPAGLTPGAWRSTRARFLSKEYGGSAREATAGWRTLEAGLRASLNEDEVVLWFEQDLFCQVNLLYVLAWYAQRRRRPALSLVTRRTLGGASPEQLPEWFEHRRPLRPAQLRKARQVWDAYCSPSPEILGALSGRRLLLPGLAAALQAHLDRLPAPEDGLDRIERAVLWLITVGFDDFGELFRAFGRAEPVYSLGDAQFLSVLRRMAALPRALITAEPSAALRNAAWRDGPPHLKLRVTRLGESILLGAAMASIRGERWVGGVHLRGAATEPSSV